MSPRVVAFYLPQYHPVAENDRWWGRGFTDWHNVARARPLYRGHRQPRLPADLGFTDLRVPEVRDAQAELAVAHGIDAFCFHHYWFSGHRLLGRPIDDVMASGRPELAFCLSWANEAWTRSWDGASDTVLQDQCYSRADDLAHIRWLATALGDRRYLRVGGRAVLLVYRAGSLPEPKRTADVWRHEADRLGVGDLLLCRVESFPGESGDPTAIGFDAAVEFQPRWPSLPPGAYRTRRWQPARRLGLVPRLYRDHVVHDYADLAAREAERPDPGYLRFPGVTPGFDNSPRRQRGALILRGATPARYQAWLEAALRRSREMDGGLVFVNAWNEWAEGCHLEPDLVDGRAYLEATAAAVASTTLTGPPAVSRERVGA